jgi:hypothetical protein
LAGVTIFIDSDNDGIKDAGELSTVTDANGDWSFSDLGVGFAGKLVKEVLPNGYVQTLGAAGYAITGTSGADQTDLDFANFEKFDLSGHKYNDLDGDGVIDAGEPGLGGVTIFIDSDDDGVLDAGELSTVTAADGSWSFNDLGPGYAGDKVKEVLPSGYVQTLGQAGYVITGTSGADQSNLDFANHVPNPGRAQTPGFWRNHLKIFDQELDQDPTTTAFDHSSKWETVFGVADLDTDGSKFIPLDPTLAQALAAKGGGEGALLRATAAALANAASDDLNYSFSDPSLFPHTAAQLATLEKIDNAVTDDQIISTAELFAAVTDIYTAGGQFSKSDINAVASALDALNNLPHIDTSEFT